MKHLFSLIAILLFQLAFSQVDLVGEWKVIAIDTGEIFYNSNTDSISIKSKELNEAYVTDSQIKTLVEFLKSSYTNSKFIFDKKGNYIQEINPKSILKLKYKNDFKGNTVVFEDKNSLGETVIYEMPYKFEDGLLFLTVNYSEPPGLYILEKIK